MVLYYIIRRSELYETSDFKTSSKRLQKSLRYILFTRIDSFQLCETEHFLNWGVLRYSKSGLVALRGEYYGTGGRLRYLGSPTNDDFTASSNIVKEFLCGFFIYTNIYLVLTLTQ